LTDATGGFCNVGHVMLDRLVWISLPFKGLVEMGFAEGIV